MGIGLKGRIEWDLIDQDTGQQVAHGADENLVFDEGRRELIANTWHSGGNRPMMALASGGITPAVTDNYLPRIIVGRLIGGTGGTDGTRTWSTPTATYTMQFDYPTGANRTVSTVALLGDTSVNAGASGITLYAGTELSTPIVQAAGQSLNVTYKVTVERYAEDV